jgi:hypothetical protein
MILEKIGSGFTWKIRPRDTEENRKAVMESILSIMIESNGTFPEKGNAFIEPEKE